MHEVLCLFFKTQNTDRPVV